MSNTSNKPQRQFFREINKWIQEGCSPHKTFLRYTGLCTSYVNWCADNRKKYYGMDLYIRHLGYDSIDHPFDDTFEDLSKAVYDETIFLNPKRLAFIKKHI